MLRSNGIPLKVLGIVPARGGSKGVPRKNIRLLCGKPLIAYTAESALQAKRLDRVILSTEDPEIAAVGERCGLDVPFMRPLELAEDETPTILVVMHALKTLNETGRHFDAICLLQPTNPLRTAAEIDHCVNLLESSGADSVVSVLRVPDIYNPKWTYLKNAEGSLELASGDSEPISRRQGLPAAFHREGSIYITRTRALHRFGNLYGRSIQPYEYDPLNSVNIDTIEDWQLAERKLQLRGLSAAA